MVVICKDTTGTLVYLWIWYFNKPLFGVYDLIGTGACEPITKYKNIKLLDKQI